MPVKRNHAAETREYNGISVYQWQAAVNTTVDAFYDLDAGSIFTRYKMGLVFINITVISGTWDFKLVTSMRLGSTGTHRHTLLGSLQVIGRTTTGLIEVGWNAYTGANLLLAEKLELWTDNTAGATPNLTFSADVVFYN